MFAARITVLSVDFNMAERWAEGGDGLRKRQTPLIRKTQPYAKKIAHRAHWIEPTLLAEIEYRAKSAEGKVRHPLFRGLREDL